MAQGKTARTVRKHETDTGKDRLTDAIVRRLSPPKRGNKVYYDSEVKGFGCRVTAAGARSFVLNYRTSRRLRELQSRLAQRDFGARPSD